MRNVFKTSVYYYTDLYILLHYCAIATGRQYQYYTDLCIEHTLQNFCNVGNYYFCCMYIAIPALQNDAIGYCILDRLV